MVEVVAVAVPVPVPVVLPGAASVAAVAVPRARLRVVQDGAQDCSVCRNMAGCWRSKGKGELGAQEIASNLLVCRLQRGIERNKTTKALLRLIRPKLQKIARWVTRRTGGSAREMVMELEGVAIEVLMTSYVMGEVVPPLVWLFNERYGGVRHWAARAVEESARRGAVLVSHDQAAGEDLESRAAWLNRAGSGIHGLPEIVEPVEEEERLLPEHYHQALAAVEDGVTLSVAEYRVLKFCLGNARDGVRVTDWLHQRMARVMRIRRKDVSRLYGHATRKLLGAAGLREAYLASKGIVLPEPRPTTKKHKRLTTEEIAGVLSTFARSSTATVTDVAWALGVTDTCIHQIKRRGRREEAERQDERCG